MKTISRLLTLSLWTAITTLTSAIPAPVPDPLPASSPNLIPQPLLPRSIGVYRPIISADNPNLCLEPAADGRIQLSPCANSATQFWGPFRNSNNIYRFQNRAFVECINVPDSALNNPAILAGCTVSNGSGNSVTNAEWDIGTNIPPAVTTTMRTHVGGSTRNICLTAVGSTVVMRTCASRPGNDQLWLIGAD